MIVLQRVPDLLTKVLWESISGTRIDVPKSKKTCISSADYKLDTGDDFSDIGVIKHVARDVKILSSTVKKKVGSFANSAATTSGLDCSIWYMSID